MMLLSFLNMKLRDFYPDLNALCQDLELDKDAIVDKLATIDYHYDIISFYFTRIVLFPFPLTYFLYTDAFAATIVTL